MSAGQVPEASHYATAETSATVLAQADVVNSDYYDNEQQIASDVSIASIT